MGSRGYQAVDRCYRADHPHILPIPEDHFTKGLGLGSPWMSNGNILQYLERNPRGDRLPLLTQRAQGLKYLHQQNPPLVHGDFRGWHILIDDAERVRLTGFGASFPDSALDIRTKLMCRKEGLARRIAPELLWSGAKYSRLSDVYAFGMTVCKIYTGPPFLGSQSGGRAVTGGRRPGRPSRLLSDELWELAERCWRVNPFRRPTSPQIVEELESFLSRRLEQGILDIQIGDLNLDPGLPEGGEERALGSP